MASANISLKQLRAFLAVAETGSFTEAATELNVTPSALSLLVKGLEREVGFRLLDRTTRRVAVSQAGKQFLPMAKSVLEGLDSVVRGATEVASVQRGLVRVGGTEIIACALMAPAIAAYQKQRPSVYVQLADTAIHSMLATLRNGDVEVVVGPANFGSSALDGNVSVTPLFVSAFAAYAPNDHPLAGRASTGWNELTRYPLIVPAFDFSSSLVPRLQEQSDTRFDGGLTSFLHARQVTNVMTGFSMAASGLGVMVAPAYMGQFASKFDLCSVSLTRPALRRVIAVYTRKNHALSPGAEDFLSFLHAFVEKTDFSSSGRSEPADGVMV
jgi:DNA-binding transcriptional LysR family regulator